HNPRDLPDGGGDHRGRGRGGRGGNPVRSGPHHRGRPYCRRRPVTLPYYASAEQIMRDRSELARKGIARGRSVIALIYADGVLFVAENPSKALHKISELYDRLGLPAVGKHNEFEPLRRSGIMDGDMRGYSYDRRDVSGRALADAYAQTLGSISTDQPKPFEVEICVAEVGRADSDDAPQLYRITYDG